MNATLKSQYAKNRGQGNNATTSLHNARLILKWQVLEDAGFVRLEVLPDESPDLSFIGRYSNRWEEGAIDRKKAGDWERNQYRYFVPATEYARQDYAEMRRVDRDGCWGVCGQFRTSPDEEWETADSCWGFIGDDYKNSGYDTDIMGQTIAELKKALQDRCPLCHRPVKK